MKIFEKILQDFEDNYQTKLLNDNYNDDIYNEDGEVIEAKPITFIDHLYRKREYFDQEELSDQLHAFIMGVK